MTATNIGLVPTAIVAMTLLVGELITETVFERELATYTALPSGATVKPCGLTPTMCALGCESTVSAADALSADELPQAWRGAAFPDGSSVVLQQAAPGNYPACSHQSSVWFVRFAVPFDAELRLLLEQHRCSSFAD